MNHRDIWWIKLTTDDGKTGFGEVAPLPGLSLEKIDRIPAVLDEIKGQASTIELPITNDGIFALSKDLAEDFASIRFGLEMALLDLKNGGQQLWFQSAFTEGVSEIPINGLIWMGDSSVMKQRIDEKLAQGFSCIKLKVGALDFNEELDLIRYLRQQSKELIIRLDANGGFSNSEAIIKLEKLSSCDIHSIEQPIMMGQPEAMAFLCERSPIPIALDEELIGVNSDTEKIELLETIEPDFLILKPSLLGGFKETKTWIDMAEYRGIGWWITSALESNLGLNAISQFTGQFDNLSFQGLGTGQLFHNNVNSRARVEGTFMTYNPDGVNQIIFESG